MSSPVSTEIDLVQVVKTIWSGKRTILYTILLFGIFGFLLALITRKEYTATTVMVNQTESSLTGSNGIEGIAAMVGFDLRSMETGNELMPEDYPDFIESLSFQYSLMHTPLTWKRFDKPVSFFEYYDQYYKPGVFKVIRKYTIGLPRVIVDWIGGGKNKNLTPAPGSGANGKLKYLTDNELWVRYLLIDNLELTLNPGNNFITLEATVPDPVAAAELARIAQELLQEKITELKINKARTNLEFTQKLYEEKKDGFMAAQDRLAKFRDQNAYLGSEQARKEEEILQSEYQIAFSVYSEMATELETARIRVKEDTPIFSVIEEVTVPNKESFPKKEMFILIWAFLGLVGSLTWVLSRRLMVKTKARWTELDE